MSSLEYRYEIHCHNPILGELFDETSGWYKDLQKCKNHCIARVNGNKIKEDLADSDCPYECLIEIYIVSNQPDTSGSSFSSYKVVNSISSTINPTDENDRYYF
jgi:hypothetical protein